MSPRDKNTLPLYHLLCCEPAPQETPFLISLQRVNPEPAFYFSFPRPCLHFCKHRAHQRLTHLCSRRFPYLPVPSTSALGWDRPYSEVLPLLLHLCQASHTGFAASSSQEFLSEHYFHFQAAPCSQCQPVPPYSSQGAEKKQGGTRSPPHLGGARTPPSYFSSPSPLSPPFLGM